MKKMIVITGTPGTGKTTLARQLASSIKGSELISANDLIAKEKLFSGYAEDGARVVRLRELEKSLNSKAKASKSSTVIIEGHILCDIRVRGATAIVLREHLKSLLGRLSSRGYSKAKVNDNIVAEATDYCGAMAAENYSKVYEIMAGKTAKKAALSIINSRGRQKAGKPPDLLPELTDLIKRDRSYLS